MAVLASNNPTLMDHAKALDPDGSIAAVVEILNQTNEMLADMTFIEGNLPTGHRTTIRTGLPAPTWRKLYGGVQPTKSTREQVTDSCGMLEAYAEVDKALADLNGNTNEFRLSEARAHIEGMTQELQETAIYGNTDTTPQRFMGLAPRYNSKSAANGDNIIDAGGTGSDNRSIWLVVWSNETCHGIVPKGSQAGLQVNDKGQVTVEDADGNGGRMEAYRTHFRMDAGLTLKDWRYVVRIANIDKSNLTADASSGANLPDLMFEATELIPSLGMGRAAFYMSRDVRTFYRQQLSNATKQSTLMVKDVGGVRSPMFQDEIPIRRVDKLAVDEARIT
ncbi:MULTISPECIES: major capsid protein [unclassified Roseobacter]|uniref:major capsid protein n=1 Tax=unclassified Roseobacter TaxID=196798 RepID=UPI001492269C|nr:MULTISPECIES: hypothetical protein [unclassified Roseobacter]NNW55507.1 hypothetical protein [Roseobacter sp. HKCCD8284]NNY17306.1 hypothetical protein [Roseobacter sp. HKCCD8191]